MPRRGQHEVPEDRQLWTFGDALRWHLFLWGTRPKGSVERSGREWRLVDFASDIGRSPRAVENWLRNANLPPNTTRIQDILFGDNKQYETWRVELRSLHEKQKHDDSTPFFIAPPEMPSFSGEIVGREDVLARIRDALAKRVAPEARVVIRGLGGVGKTSVATEYLRRFGPTYDGTWWCRSETRAALLSSLANLGRELQESDQQEADVERAARSALTKLSTERKRWLIVYDNVPSPEQIQDLLPQGETALLVTSRFAYWSRWATEVELDVLSTESSASLLERLASRTDPEGARSLVELLGKLPLAIDHAAAFCERSGLSFAGYAHKIGELIKILPAGGSYPQSVHATFSLAIEAAVQKASATEFLMSFLSYCAPERVPRAFVDVALQHEPDPYLAVAALSEVSLIKHDPYADGVPAVTVHRLVQEVGRSRAKEMARANSAVNLMVACLNGWFPHDSWNEPDTWETCEQLLPHVLALKDAGVEPEPARWSELLDKVGAYFYGRGNSAEAISLQRHATSIAEKRAPTGSAETGRRLHNLAASLLAAGDVDGALRQVRQALKMRPARDLERATSLSLYGRLLQHSGKLDEARKVSEEALEMATAAEGANTSAIATLMNNLAVVLDAQDDLAASVKLDQRALAIRQRELGDDHVEVAQSLHNLALSYVRLDEFAEALALMSRAAEIKRQKFGIEHPETLLTEYNRADILAHNGRFSEAEELSASVVELARKKLGSTDERTALYEVGWAKILLELKRAEKAFALATAALTILENAHSPFAGRAGRQKIACLRALGRNKEAESLVRRYGQPK